NQAVSALAVIGLVGFSACKEAEEPAKVAAIIGMNPVDSVRLNKTFTFLVETRDASGNKLTGRKIAWTSINPNVATVDANGVVNGVGLGSSVITGRVDGVSAQ